METASLRDFKGPGIRSTYKRISFVGYLAFSPRRMVVRADFCHSIDINTTYDDQRFDLILFHASDSRLVLEFNADGFPPDSSGTVEIDLHLPETSTATNIMKANGARFKSPLST